MIATLLAVIVYRLTDQYSVLPSLNLINWLKTRRMQEGLNLDWFILRWGFITMDIDALMWLLIPFLILVVWVVVAKARPSALKLSRKSNYVVAIVVIALVTVYTIWNYFFRR